ncbi:hypothetical protein D3C73_1155890 [compost metagenome]
MAGMMINIILLSAQLVSSGAIVPRELLNSFYQNLSYYLPATYAVEGIMNVLFGGPRIAAAVIKLIIICFIVLVVGALVVLTKKETKQVKLAANG